MKTKPVNGSPVTVTETLDANKAKNWEVARLSDGRVAYIFSPTVRLGPSASGKTTLVSTTGGALNVPGLPTIAVNSFTK
jgi:ATP-dependent protease Clp ATPase subunit